ncbi:PD-(D/E)XK nuclease family protein [Sinomicrobium kalidii]|uniref:PD-(D/E)XK nuclease family protein n=1 Tax=Sinomicrobium kalidii TaxID=2900738 RepID=UPI001E466973|nr:PD-(D/E)XK nuclease family protein [Sinomicrobium kalidii]UGU14247.1 PD-(D/E)XK nuclease family protein [Sinomicrobium kalidii]
MDDKLIPVETVQERDIDLILLEELSSDNTFCEWLIQELSLPALLTSNGAWKSISDFGLGETDIIFSYTSILNKKIYVLIENKLDASFQKSQSDRYRERGEKYVIQRYCDEAYCILIAPQSYCNNQNDFELFVTYETIRNRFNSVDTLRNRFKSTLLKIAIEKLRRRYQPVNSEPVQKFWYSYWSYKEKHYPSLKMKEPKIVPQNSDWPALYDDNLNGIVFYHKLRKGYIDAEFKGFPVDFDNNIKGKLPKWVELIKYKNNIAIRAFTDKIESKKEFKAQLIQVEKGLKKVEELRGLIIKTLISKQNS